MHVLVPVDGSTHSEKALDYVLDNVPDPTITLVHVVNPISVTQYAYEEDFDSRGYERALEQRRGEAEELLDEYREKAALQDIEIETVLAAGSPVKRILETADDRDVDHIVMGSRGRSGVGRVLFGSVAESVTRRAVVPVTIVR